MLRKKPNEEDPFAESDEEVKDAAIPQSFYPLKVKKVNIFTDLISS